MPIGLALTRRRGRSRLSWLVAGARSAEHLRRHMARSGRTLSGQKLWTAAEVKHLRRFYPDYRKACAALPNRSLNAIRSKAFRLRITRSRRVWSEDELKRMKAPYRQRQPMHEILALLPGKTKRQIWRKARYSGWRRPRAPPKSYDLKPYDDDLPPNFHPAAVRVWGFCTPSGAGGATGDRRSWSGLRSRSPVAVNVAA